jgi:LysM repeat protein
MTSYTIRSGDTLGSIASRYHTSVQALARANGIANPNVIYAGRTLRIPVMAAAHAIPANDSSQATLKAAPPSPFPAVV